MLAATTELPDNPITVDIVSRNDGRFLILAEAHPQLGYRLRDNASYSQRVIGTLVFGVSTADSGSKPVLPQRASGRQ